MQQKTGAGLLTSLPNYYWWDFVSLKIGSFMLPYCSEFTRLDWSQSGSDMNRWGCHDVADMSCLQSNSCLHSVTPHLLSTMPHTYHSLQPATISALMTSVIWLVAMMVCYCVLHFGSGLLIMLVKNCWDNGLLSSLAVHKIGLHWNWLFFASSS